MSDVETIKECRSYLYKVVSRFFAHATVIWAEQINTKPKAPYVTLKVMSPSQQFFPTRQDAEGSQREIILHIEINLYTQGRRVSGSGQSANYENTSIEDMHDFTNYLESEYTLDDLVAHNVTFIPTTQPKDLSYIENSTQFRYRSMIEADVTFVENNSGAYLVMNMPQETNASGGGTKETHETPLEYIESEEIKEDFTNGRISEE